MKEEEKPPKRKKNENPIAWMSKIKLEESVVEELVVPEPKRKPGRPAGSKSENKTCFVEAGGKIMKIKMEEVQANVDAKDRQWIELSLEDKQRPLQCTTCDQRGVMI